MTVYTIQALQTNNADSTILLGRNTAPMALWPRLSFSSVLPNARQQYRKSQIVFTQPQTVVVDGLDTAGPNGIMDLTFKFPKGMSDAEINAFVIESLKIVNTTDLIALYKSQARLSADVTTA